MSLDPWSMLVAATASLLVAAPVLYSAWLRWRLGGRDDLGDRWFGILRSQGTVMRVAGLGWVIFFIAAVSTDTLEPLPPRDAPALMAFLFSFLLLPIATSAVASKVILYPLLEQSELVDWTQREVLGSELAEKASTVLPFIAVMCGVGAILDSSPRLGVGYLALAFVSRQILSTVSLRTRQLELHAVSTGTLRDRIFELAGKAGVELEQILVYRTRKERIINAFALRGNRLLLSDDLIRRLDRREVDGIVAHELAHLAHRHTRAAPALLLLHLLVVVAIVVTRSLGLLVLPLPAHIALLIGWLIAFFLLFFALSRRRERIADAGAVEITGDAEGLISALLKLHARNRMPIAWGRVEERVSTHPSTRRRVERLAAIGNVPSARLDEILEAVEGRTGSSGRDSELEPSEAVDDQERHDPAAAADRRVHGGSRTDSYELPPDVETEARLFSTVAKARALTFLALTIRGTAVTAAALVAVAAASLVPASSPAVWTLVPLQLLAALVAHDVASSLLGGRLYRRLAPALRARLESGDLGAIARHGDPVGLAPADRARIYEGFSDWDLGFVAILGNRLVYVGEQTRFAIERESIVTIEAAPGGLPTWRRYLRVHVAWRDGDGTTRVFQLRPLATRCLWCLNTDVRNLAKKLESWRSAEVGSVVDGVERLGPPAPGEITSAPPRSVGRLDAVLRGALYTITLAVAAAVLFGLDLTATATVLTAGVLNELFWTVPYWRHRES